MKGSRNFIFQFTGQGIGKLITFLFYIFLPSLIGPLEYGKFSFLLALSLIIVQPIVEMGLDILITKWIVKGKSDVFKKAFFIRMYASLIAFFILFLISFFLDINRYLLFLIFSYHILGFFQNIIFSSLRGIEDMRFEGIIFPIQRLLAFLFLFILFYLGIKDAFLAPFSLLLSLILGLAVLLFLTKDILKDILNKGEEMGYNDLIKEGFFLGLITLLWLIYFKIDSIMLGIMKGDFEVGIYNVSYRIMDGILFIPGTIMLVFFPKLSKDFKGVFWKLFFVLGGIGLIVSFILYLFAPILIKLIYGAKFLPSIPVLQILSLAIFFIFLGHLATQSLVALDRSNLYLLVAFIGTALNIFLNFLLIPSLGAIGAAYATVITEGFVMLFCFYFVWKR
ncbi:MAG: flippase [bacterium]